MTENKTTVCYCRGFIAVTLALLTATLFVLYLYVWNGPFTSADIPLYLTNKIFAFTIMELLFIMSVIPFSIKIARKIIGISTFVLMIFHVILSVFLVSSPYFRFYYNSSGFFMPKYAWGFLFGIIAFVISILFQQGFYLRRKNKSFPFTQFFVIGIIIIFTSVLLHILLVDRLLWEGWEASPPDAVLDLVSLVLMAAAIAANFFRYRHYKKLKNDYHQSAAE